MQNIQEYMNSPGREAGQIPSDMNKILSQFYNASLILGRGEFELVNLITADECMQERKRSEECCLIITFRKMPFWIVLKLLLKMHLNSLEKILTFTQLKWLKMHLS